MREGVFRGLIDNTVAIGDRAVVARLRELELERRRLDAETAAVLAVADAQGVYGTDGHRTLKSFVRANSNGAPITAHRQVRVSKLVNRYPAIGDAMLDGRLGFDQADKLAEQATHPRTKDVFGDFAEMLTEAAVMFDWNDFLTVIDRYRLGADPDGVDRARDESVEGRNARVVADGGEVDISAVGGDAVTAAELVAIFDRFVEDEYQADLEARREAADANTGADVPMRTNRQRRFDAMVKLFRTAALNRQAAADRPVSKFDVSLILGAAAFERLLQHGGLIPTVDDPAVPTDLDELRDHLCQTSEGGPVASADALKVLLTGTIQRVVMNQADVPINMGRASRLFRGHAAKAARLLIETCDHPGCDLPAKWCDIDHNHEWSDHGRTDQDNRTLPCHTHNQWKHDHQASYVTDLYGKRRLKRADGTLVLPVGMPSPIIIPPEPFIAPSGSGPDRLQAFIASVITTRVKPDDPTIEHFEIPFSALTANR